MRSATRSNCSNDRTEGWVSARAVGIAHATGEYVACLDADDLWDPDALTVQVDVATRNPASGLVVSDGIAFDHPEDPDLSLFSTEADELFADPGQQELTGWFHREFTMVNRVACPAQTLVPRCATPWARCA